MSMGEPVETGWDREIEDEFDFWATTNVQRAKIGDNVIVESLMNLNCKDGSRDTVAEIVLVDPEEIINFHSSVSGARFDTHFVCRDRGIE